MIGARDPRERDPAYMAWIAGLPCAICMVHGTVRWGVHVAHLRAGSLEHDKRSTGMAEKPSDRPWTSPLCPTHHVNGPNSQHAFGDEVAFWRLHGLDPFDLCVALSEAYGAGRSGASVIALKAADARRLLDA